MTGKNVGMWLVVLGFLTVCGAVGGGARGQADGTVAAARQPKLAEEQFKNIQVLKGIPADQLIPAMMFITASLGVECDFCHVEGAFEKDDKKPKQTARKMMEMMFAINKENFDGHREVTCYSCHRGSTKPLATPMVMAEEPKEVDTAMSGANKTGTATGPTADQLFEHYLKATGGAAAIEKITSRVEKGTIEFAGKSFPIDIYDKDPDKRVSFTHMPQGDNITDFDGHEGWLAPPGRPVRDMHGPDLDGAAIDADLHLPLHLRNMFSGVRVAPGAEKIEGRDAYIVVGQRDGKTPLQLYFDQQTGLLIRLVRFGDTPLGLLPTQIDYEDYREVGGVKVPFRWTLARATGRFTIQATDIKQNVPVNDARFARPSEPAQHPNSAK
ncbi:MAG TPA: c-type cytochrome [Candidatus Aquilonibacter sp.]|nr:c-type cytochrome [Candidatus Aquilonibacter sp.]